MDMLHHPVLYLSIPMLRHHGGDNYEQYNSANYRRLGPSEPKRVYKYLFIGYDNTQRR